MNRNFWGRLLAICLLLSAAQAHAAYVWLDRDASGNSKAYFGELNGKKEAVAGLSALQAYAADGRSLGTTTETESISISTPVGGDLRFTARTVGASGAVQLYSARFGRTETKAVNELELVPTETGGNTFKLIWKGAAVPATQVNVGTADGWSRVLKPEADGTVKLPTSVPGLYVLEVTVKINGGTTIDGKKYDEVRHTATLSFIVAERCK